MCPSLCQGKDGHFLAWGPESTPGPHGHLPASQSAWKTDAGTQQAAAGSVQPDSALESNAKPCVDTGQNGQYQATQSDGARHGLLCVPASLTLFPMPFEVTGIWPWRPAVDSGPRSRKCLSLPRQQLTPYSWPTTALTLLAFPRDLGKPLLPESTEHRARWVSSNQPCPTSAQHPESAAFLAVSADGIDSTSVLPHLGGVTAGATSAVLGQDGLWNSPSVPVFLSARTRKPPHPGSPVVTQGKEGEKQYSALGF